VSSGEADAHGAERPEVGDKIVTGSYKVLRSLRNGARIKQEKIEVKKDEESS